MQCFIEKFFYLFCCATLLSNYVINSQHATEHSFVQNNKDNELIHDNGKFGIAKESHFLHDVEGEIQEDDKKDTLCFKCNITSDYDFDMRGVLDAADELLESNETDAALKVYRGILAQHSVSPRAQYGVARSLDAKADKEKRNELLEQSIDEYYKLVKMDNVPKHLMKLATDKLMERMRFRGWHYDAVGVLNELIHRFPEDLYFYHQKGSMYILMGMPIEAEKVYRNILKKKSDDGLAQANLGFILDAHYNDTKEAVKYLSAGIKSDDAGVHDSKFYIYLGDALIRLDRKAEASEIFYKGAEKGLFPSAYQRSPDKYNIAGLTARPWWTAEQLGSVEGVKMLEDNWAVIRDEALAQMDIEKGVFQLDKQKLAEEGEWKQFVLFDHGKVIESACKKAPRTCEIVSQISGAATCRRGRTKFSVIQPGTHIWPHVGPTNQRIRAHLGLVTPPGAKIRVVDEEREWEAGKVLIFDDSFEHEVWNNADTYRLILIIDFWHPDISKELQDTLEDIL